MAASIALSPSQKDIATFPAHATMSQPGNFVAPLPPQNQAPTFAVPQRPHRTGVSSLNRSGTFATPAPPRRRLQQQLPLRPSSLPRPVRNPSSLFSSFSSAVTEAMETDTMVGQASQQSHQQPWSSIPAPASSATFGTPTSFSPFDAPPSLPPTASGSNIMTGPAASSQFFHQRTSSAQSEPDNVGSERTGCTFFTPQAKLVKPNPSAFHSTGLLSKKNRPRPANANPMPETPLKKGTPIFTYDVRGNDIFSRPPPPTAPPAITTTVPGTPTSGLPPTPTRFAPPSVNKHYRSPLQESPIKNTKKLHFNAEDASPTSIKSFRPSRPLFSQTDFSQTDFSLQSSAPFSQSEFASSVDAASSPSSDRTRPRSLSSPARQGSTHRLQFSTPHDYHIGNGENATPSIASTSPGFNPFASARSAVERSVDMMDCDDDIHTPPNPSSATAALMSTRQPVLTAYSHLVTPYPLFLTADYFHRLHARNGRPPSPDARPSRGIYPDYLDTHFRIIDRLGRGSFADAYKVQSKLDGKLYAVKKTRQAFTGYKDGLNKLEEVEILWGIGDSPHCVKLVNAWVQYGYLYLQMELCAAGSLHAYLEEHCRDSSLDEYRIWHILAEIAMGLKHIHDLDLVHLDIKPGNVLISENGALKIGDFGLAAKSPVPRYEEREGDRTYIAPEILRDAVFGKPADIFSLGLIILEITANVILPENGPYWHKLREGDLTEINFPEDVSQALLDLIRSMLDPNPTTRPTADAILSHPYVAQIVAKQSICGALAARPDGAV